MTYLSIIFSFDTLVALACFVYLVYLLVSDYKTRDAYVFDPLSIKPSLSMQKVERRPHYINQFFKGSFTA